MKAYGLENYGGPEVMHEVTLPEEHAGAGQVRIRVAAAGVNPADTQVRDGSLADFFRGMTPPYVPGMDVAGTVDDVGDGVEGISAGDAVVGLVANSGSYGGYSEYVVLPAASVTAAPKGAGSAEAASWLMNALTARCALDVLALQPGSTLLVTGAPGAFGGYVTQLAAAEGLRVLAVGRRSDAELLRGFGADVILAAGDDLVERVRREVPDGVDGLADGAALHGAVAPALGDGGRLATVRGWTGDPGPGRTVVPVNVRDRAEDHAAIERLREQVEAGELAMRVARVLPAAEVVEAHRLLDAGGLRGRVVLDFEA
ncbi:NADP-dependent oxidoreductase [Pseudonocardia xishanensis]|uniref:NADP-dependent oxidoreductase n=1 Tax=Pseudonocardia xishanensis TaxID=630995 RepID=A0ABP8RYK6_9PSEU